MLNGAVAWAIIPGNDGVIGQNSLATANGGAAIGYSSSSWIVPAIYGAGGAATFSNPTLRGSAGAVFIRYLSV